MTVPVRRHSHLRMDMPTHEFFYTLDQIAMSLSVSERWLKRQIAWVGREVTTDRDRLRATNMALPDQRPVWRVSEREFRRWCTRHGVRPAQTTQHKRNEKDQDE